MTRSNRHLSREALGEYLAQTGPATIVVPGDPACRVTVDPAGAMTIGTPGRRPLPELGEFERIQVRHAPVDGSVWSELVVEHGDRPYEAYLLLSDVVDLVQSGHAFHEAVRDAVDTFESLLARGGALGPEQQTGLFGELLFLEHCLNSLCGESAVAAWKGPIAHEHDFVFPGVSFEVKTTRGTRRRHRIGRLEQLQPPTDAALWLLSIQLTEGSTSSRTLPELVDAVCAAAGPTRPALEAALLRAGWRERDRARYRRRSTLATAPTAYRVDNEFPSLTRPMVDQISARPELIVDASYTIDLTSAAASKPPAPAAHFVAGDA